MSDSLEPLDPDDIPIEHSPLERDVTRDGETVHIFIYRGPQDPGWLLEIEDELGGSTCWGDHFDTDQAALDEALQTIEEDGIHSLRVPPDDRQALRALWNVTTAQPDIAELKRTLDAPNGSVSFQRACGIFAALASTPEMRSPSEWLAMIKADRVFTDLEDVQRFTNGLMALYNEVLQSVNDADAHCCPAPEDHDAVREFCEGYVSIAISDPTALQDKQAFSKLVPLCALAGAVPDDKLRQLADAHGQDPERWLQQAREELSETVLELHADWDDARRAAAQRVQQPQRRTTPKVGRNERCPCGSGKKFKKCCAA
jgi:uncharacterized protein YecA (UPF0149 family)